MNDATTKKAGAPSAAETGQPVLAGVFAAALTPLDARLAPDHARLVRHGRWLLDNGCDGLGILGTTGEANSFSVEERQGILEAVVGAGIAPASLLPGTGACALPDAVRLTRHAMGLGCGGALVLPPFYYKGVSDDGLFGFFAELIERVGDARLRLYLYHFPQMTNVPLSFSLIERLRARYPTVIAGMKDSSGDLANMTDAARRFPGFAVFSGSDELLLDHLRAGGAGCITAAANIAAPLAAEVMARFRSGRDATAVQATLTQVRRAITAHPPVAALKTAIAERFADPDWLRVRPPLTPLAEPARRTLAASLAASGFTLPTPA